MALIKSKQLKNVSADKIIESAEKQFTSATEKAAFADKYTKAEADAHKQTLQENIDTVNTNLTQSLNTKATELQGNIDTVNQTLTESINTVNTTLAAEIDDVEDSLTTQLGNVNNNLTNQINTVQSALQQQITNAIAGLTWKSPVPTFDDIATIYPEPAEGWMVTVEDTDKVYRYDYATTSWVEFPIQVPQSFARTILVPVPVNAVTKLYTGIRNDNTGVYKTGHKDVDLFVNGFSQVEGEDKDYTTEFENHELVITWNNRHFQLETDDEVEVTYTHFDII